MKIVILFLAIIGFSFAAASTTAAGLCLELEVDVFSSIEPKRQSFGIDMRKIKLAKFEERKESFGSQSHIPLQEAGLVLEKKKGTELSEGHHKYLRNTGESVWMPYAYAGEWYRHGYKISNQMTRMSTSKTVKPFVSFEFKFDAELKNISDQDMNVVLEALRSNSVKRQAIRKALKDSILKAQNNYLTAKNSYDTTKKNNADLKKRIADLEKQLEEVIKKIAASDKIIEKTEQERLKAVEKETNAQHTLERKTSDLKVEKKQLVDWETEYKNWKPISTKENEELLKWALSKMNFPPKAPEEFKIEYGTSKYKAEVEKDYATCDNKRENAKPCWEAIKATNVNAYQRKSFF